MYLLPVIMLIFCLLFGGWFYRKRKRLREKICAMDPCERILRVNELLRPFGFVYKEKADAVSTLHDAWQREFGYRKVYDRTAPWFNMVFDCQPVYFEYEGKTWLIEFWKGQYGINTGGEIGIYHADKILTEQELKTALFRSASDEEQLPLSMELFRCQERKFQLGAVHWWLSGFRVGEYCEPWELSMIAAVTFRDEQMRDSFLEGMFRAGCRPCDLRICGETVSFLFRKSHCGGKGLLQRIVIRWAQMKNRIFVRLYRWMTRPFEDTVCRILYLYESLPFAFRHMFRFQRGRKQGRRKRGRRWRGKKRNREQRRKKRGCGE